MQLCRSTPSIACCLYVYVCMCEYLAYNARSFHMSKALLARTLPSFSKKLMKFAEISINLLNRL